MELEITWGRAIKIWWAYIWRYMITTMAGFMFAAILGAMVGAPLASFGVSDATIDLFLRPILFVVGMVITFLPLKLILGKDFGEFKLVLLKK